MLPQPTTTRILVTLEGAPADQAAISLASRLATGLDAEVLLLRVVAPPALDGSRVQQVHADLGQLIDRLERQADVELQRHEPAFAGHRVSRIVLVGTQPINEILDWLRAHPVDFVVTAAHEEHRLRHLLHHVTGGEMAEALQQSGLAPVVTARLAVAAA